MTKVHIITLEQYMEEISEINPKYNDTMIAKAFEIAKDLHKAQYRKSGEPYIIHPIAVSKILATFGMDNETIVAGLLHDVVEDTDYTREQLVEDFDESIALLVDGVTKLGNIKYDTKEQMQAENFRKMFLAMAKDIRVLIIKLADRLHNMRTLEYMPTNKREEKALETLEIYAPLAGRLGIYSIKFELEDLALKYLHPIEYKRLAKKVAIKKANYEKNLESLITDIDTSLNEADIQHDIKGRSKHLYSIYRKMKQQDKQLDEIFDLLAVRVLVQNLKDCYEVLGIVHTKWKPIPGRFKAYIAMPKTNMYQSLHTTVIGNNGEPFEIQIRTYEMHRVAEYGIAAHWKYKEGRGADAEAENEEKLAWLRQALELQKESEDSIDFLETMKVDLFDNQVFVFSPNGDVMELPYQSTPLDFAFKVHTDVGNRCVGAKVNGKMVPIGYELNNGDIVEIVTSANSSGPSMDWLNICKSSQAKHKIRNWLRKQNKDDDLDRGKNNIQDYVKRKGYDPGLIVKNSYILKACKTLNFDTVNEMYMQVSRGGSILSKVSQKLIDYYIEDTQLKEIQKEESLKKKKPVNRGLDGSDVGSVVKGTNNLLIRRATCCNPVPGDEITGYVSKGKGINVHRADCPNIVNLSDEDKARLIEVAWDTPKSGQSYYVDIQIRGVDRKGMFSDLSKACEDNETILAGVNMKPVTEDEVSLIMTVSISDMHQLRRLLISLRQVPGVTSAYRNKS